MPSRTSLLAAGSLAWGMLACSELQPEASDPTDDAATDDVDEADDGGPGCGNGSPDPGEDCDDGNDDPLDGCLASCRFGPVGFAFGLPFATPLRGSADNGTQADDRCMEGQVLVGLEGHVGGMGENWLRGLRGRCGTLELTHDEGMFGVRVVEGDPLGFRGNGGTEINGEARCPDDHVVVGFSGMSGAFIHRLALLCAPISIVDQGGTPTVEVGEASPTESFGGEGGASFDQATCGADAVALITNIRFENHVDAFGLGCAQLVLEMGS